MLILLNLKQKIITQFANNLALSIKNYLIAAFNLLNITL
jgi:hypothetical protein